MAAYRCCTVDYVAPLPVGTYGQSNQTTGKTHDHQ